MIESILARPEVGRLGWALVHFVWQGALAAAVLAVILHSMRRRTAGARYLAATAALFCMALAPVATFFMLPQSAAPRPDGPAAGRVNDPTPATVPTDVQAPQTTFSTGPSVPAPPSIKTAPVVARNTPPRVSSPTNSSNQPPALAPFRLSAWFEPVLPWLVAGWIVGVACLSLRLLGGMWRVRQLTRRHVQPVAQLLRDRLNMLAARLGLKRTVRLFESAVAAAPLTIGWIKPVILLPASILIGLAPDQIEALIAHELAHIRRHDYLINLMQTVVETLLFYHPAVWWVSRRMRIEREFACDDLAAGACGNAVSYARALVEMETLRAATPQPALSAAAGALFERVARLMARPVANDHRGSAWTAGLLGLVFLCMLGWLCTPVAKPAAAQTETKPVPQGRVVLRLEDPERLLVFGYNARLLKLDDWAKRNDPELRDKTFWNDDTRHELWTTEQDRGDLRETSWFDHVAPGVYRVLVVGDPRIKEDNGIYFVNGVEGPIYLSERFEVKEGRQYTDVTIRPRSGEPLTIRAQDSKTREPIIVPVEIADGYGFPIAKVRATTNSHGEARFSSLEPGKYFIEIQRNNHIENAVEQPVTIEPGKPAVVEIALNPTSVKDSNLEDYIVEGTVTDENGKPLEGVTISGQTCEGTCWPIGETLTGPDGRYTFHTPVSHMRIPRRSWKNLGMKKIVDYGTDPWSCRLLAGKEGYYEKSLGRNGNYTTDGKSRRIDFVMNTAAHVSGRIVDPRGKAVFGVRFNVNGTSSPLDYTLAECRISKDGRFDFRSVPRWPCVFSLNTGRIEVRGRDVHFTRAGDYEFEIVYDENASTMKTRLVSKPVGVNESEILSPERVEANKEPRGGEYAWGPWNENIRLGAGSQVSEQPLASIIHDWHWVQDDKDHGHHEPGPGTPVVIRYTIDNSSDRQIFYYNAPSSALITRAVWSGGSIKVTGPDGRPLQLRRGVSSGGSTAIQPNSKHDGFIRLTDYFDFPTTGTYRVSLFLQMHNKTLFGGDKIIGVASGTFPLTLTGGPAPKPAPLSPEVMKNLDALTTGSQGSREHAAYVLGEIGSGTMVPRLFQLLREGDVETRRAAARAFSYGNGVILDDIFVVHMREMLGRDFPPELEKKPAEGVRFGAAMNSSNENAREAARKCFESSRRELRFSPVVRGLIEALGDPDPQVRKTIKNTLEQNYSDGMRYGEDREMWRAWFAKNDPQWGEPVDGVMARLRTLDPELGAPGRVMGETGRIRNDENPPVVFLDLRKDGRPNYSLYAPQEDFELDVDGNKFHLAVPLAAEWRTLTGGEQFNGLRVELGREWKGAGGPLHWTPGMHQVRLSVKLHPPLSDPSRPIEVVSNPVAIRILSADGAQRTVDNLKYEAGFVPDKTVALLGEEVMISFFVKNTGERPIYLAFGFDSRGIRPLRFQISAVDSNGNPVRDPYPNAAQMDMGGFGGNAAIQPGLAHNERLPISKWCAFTKPGVYTVTCRTAPDINKTNSMLGWGARQPNASRHTVSTSFTLTLRAPTDTETQRVIATRRAEADKEHYQSNTGMSTLRAPLFLAPLLEKGRAGDIESIKAIGGIETPESTQALIGLAQEKIKAGRLDIAHAAIEQVVWRLPNPRYYDEEKDWKTGKTTGKLNSWSEADRQRVARTWRPEMAGPVREIARRLVEKTDQKCLDLAGRILWDIGTAEDMPAALAGYTRAIESTQALPYKPEFYLQSSAAYVYAFTIGELLKRGGKIPDRPATLGESAAYLVALSADKSFQPADRRQQIQRLIAADVPFMNFLMLQQLNDPVPEALAAKVPEFMRSKYKDVQKAAIEFARRHPRAEYKQPLADALKILDDSFMMMVANGAATANAIPTIELVDIWFGRIAPTDSGREALRYLIESATDGGMVNSATTLNAEETAAVKERWGRFIRENRARLSQGKRFKPGDPEFTPDLMPPGFTMTFGQTAWPPKS